jgi:hypothetical protein
MESSQLTWSLLADPTSPLIGVGSTPAPTAAGEQIAHTWLGQMGTPCGWQRSQQWYWQSPQADRLSTLLPPEARPAVLDPVRNVPAGTSSPESAVCHIDGVGSIEPATAQRLACDNPMLGALIDEHGKVLALGRTRRLVSKPLRRALMIRDKMCRYPGCHQTRHLDAHHVIPWIQGGRTDLQNLILLCRWHHTAVHEGGVSITRDGEGWVFTKPDGQPCDWWVDEQNLARHLDFALRR